MSNTYNNPNNNSSKNEQKNAWFPEIRFHLLVGVYIFERYEVANRWLGEIDINI
jgi:hypothetical protein